MARRTQPRSVPKTHSIEREIKYVLDERGYAKLRSVLKDRHGWTEARQENHYYRDDLGVLEAARMIVRLRIETPGHTEASAKVVLASLGIGERGRPVIATQVNVQTSGAHRGVPDGA